MKKTKEEGFDLLNYLGVEMEVQRLFFPVIREEEPGILSFIYKNTYGETADKECFSLVRFKQASKGMAECCQADPHTVTDIYVSTSMMNLIAFCHIHFKRISFHHAAFLSTGVKPERDLFLNRWAAYNKGKIHTLFGNSLLGKVMDCKIAHLVRGEDFSFYVDRNHIISSGANGKTFRIPYEGFSMRSYFRRIGGKNKVATHKPSIISIDNYIDTLINKTL